MWGETSKKLLGRRKRLPHKTHKCFCTNVGQALSPAVLLARVIFSHSLVLAAQEPPVFHANTRLVQINVIVHDKNGPVSNLTKNDFTVTDRGKAQTISVFSVESARLEPRDAAPLPQNNFSNRQHGGQETPASVTVILLDRLNTLSGPGAGPYEETPTWVEDMALANAKNHLVKFIEQLNPRDRIAIYGLGRSLEVLSDFSSNREQLQTVLKNYRAISLTNRETVEPLGIHTPVPGQFNGKVDADRRNLAAIANQSRSETTMSALMAIAAHVAGIPGRKNLVWLTANLPFPGAAIGRALSRANIAIYPVDARGLLPQAPPMTEDDSRSRIVFGRNGVAAGQGPEPTGISTMDDLAEESGGRAFTNSNDLTNAIHEAVEDAAVSYTLGFYPDSDSLDGKFHALKVHVKHAGLEVRYPKAYFASPDAQASEAQNQNSLVTAVQSPLESSAIRIAAQLERASQLVVTASVDLRDLQLTRNRDVSDGAIELFVIQQDTAGNVLVDRRYKYNLRLTAEQHAAYLKSGLLFRESVEPKEGLATLRILVRDPSNAAVGSVIIPFSQVK
jgi:VWFA-related protein